MSFNKVSYYIIRNTNESYKQYFCFRTIRETFEETWHDLDQLHHLDVPFHSVSIFWLSYVFCSIEETYRTEARRIDVAKTPAMISSRHCYYCSSSMTMVSTVSTSFYWTRNVLVTWLWLRFSNVSIDDSRFVYVCTDIPTWKLPCFPVIEPMHHEEDLYLWWYLVSMRTVCE